MDALDAFDTLYRATSRAVALLKTAYEYGESSGAEETIMLSIETVLDMMSDQEEAWGLLEKAVSQR